MLRMKAVFIILICMVWMTLSISQVYADRGLIPVNPDVSVYEPGQKAIVAWNGHEEILILSTDVTASEQTFVVELLPLPSEPEVEAASFSSFETIQVMIWSEGMSLSSGMTYQNMRDASVEVVFHEEIGAHNITVVKATDSAELIDWVEDVLKDNAIAQSFSLGDFEPVVEDYMGRGYRYYALDLVEFLPDVRSVDPILYRFNSSFLYYPLAITSPVPGETEITLFLLTQDKVEKDYFPMRKGLYKFQEGFRPIELVLSKGELSKIDLRIGQLFNDMAWLSVLKYEGVSSSITTDLMMAEDAFTPSTTPAQIVNLDLNLVFPAAMVVFFMVLGAAIALVAVVCTALVLRLEKARTKTT